MPYSSLQELQEHCADCRRCGLCEERTQVVFGVGNEHSRLLFIGEGPGENEDLQGEPFVGRAGKLLDKLLITIGLDRSMVYIANIVKCRPPQNRDPLPEEQEACIGYLREQVRLIQPKLIVCLGRIAAQRIISPDFKVTRQHGQWIERKGVHLMGTFQPSRYPDATKAKCLRRSVTLFLFKRGCFPSLMQKTIKRRIMPSDPLLVWRWVLAGPVVLLLAAATRETAEPFVSTAMRSCATMLSFLRVFVVR